MASLLQFSCANLREKITCDSVRVDPRVASILFEIRTSNRRLSIGFGPSTGPDDSRLASHRDTPKGESGLWAEL